VTQPFYETRRPQRTGYDFPLLWSGMELEYLDRAMVALAAIGRGFRGLERGKGSGEQVCRAILGLLGCRGEKHSGGLRRMYRVSGCEGSSRTVQKKG